MKVNELREQIKKYARPDLERLTVELIFRTHAKRYEFEQGVAYYQQQHYER